MRIAILPAFCWLALSRAAMAAIAVTNIGTFGPNTTTAQITGVTVPGGATILVPVSEQDSTAGNGSMSDGGTNTYTQRGHTAWNGSDALGHTGIWAATNVTALSSATLTFTRHTASTSVAMNALYVTGLGSGNAEDTNALATATGLSTAPSVTSGTPSNSNDVFIGDVGYRSLAAQSFTQDSTNGAWAAPPNDLHGTINEASNSGGFLVVTGSATHKYAPTLGQSAAWADIIMAYSPPAAGGTSGQMLPLTGTGSSAAPIRHFAANDNVQQQFRLAVGTE